MLSLPAVRMFPHEGVGGCTPRPRNERPLSVRIAPATPSTAATSTGAIAFGRMCRKISRASPAPSARAATTKSRSRRLRNSARTSRQTPIQPVMPMTNITFQMLGPMNAITVRIRKVLGKQSMMSTKRITSESTTPPKNPAHAPSVVPMNTAMPTETNPTASEMRAP